jgi:hypothetical protein
MGMPPYLFIPLCVLLVGSLTAGVGKIITTKEARTAGSAQPGPIYRSLVGVFQLPMVEVIILGILAIPLDAAEKHGMQHKLEILVFIGVILGLFMIRIAVGLLRNSVLFGGNNPVVLLTDFSVRYLTLFEVPWKDIQRVVLLERLVRGSRNSSTYFYYILLSVRDHSLYRHPGNKKDERHYLSMRRQVEKKLKEQPDESIEGDYLVMSADGLAGVNPEQLMQWSTWMHRRAIQLSE